MLEIVHDLAPKAALGFATVDDDEAVMAENIRALRFDAGCDILVDDVVFFSESPFQDGPIAQAVNDVMADGALYFSSAGNQGNTLDGTAGNYEGDFIDSRQGVGKFVGTAEDFDPGPAVQVFDPLSDSSYGLPVTLFWADPLGAANDDYDLYLFDSDGNVIAFSQNVQDGDDDPFERLGTPLDFGMRLAVVKYKGSSRYFQVTVWDGRFAASDDGLKPFATAGVIRGHAATAGAFAIAAAPAFEPLPFDLEPGDPPNPSGPFPNPFTKAQKPERFTSDGPRRAFFAADGTPYTPGNYSSTGGVVRPKPDFTAADGVSTSLPDFSPFFGTSAAAPHAAAIAALVLSGNPGASAGDVRAAFAATGLDLAPAGTDNRSGGGLLRADRVLTQSGATPQPLVTAAAPTVAETAGDGDGFLEPGEKGTLTLPVTNEGDGTATGISVAVASSEPGARITPASLAYGNLAAGASRAKAFKVALAADYPLGKPFKLSVRVSFAGALSPTTAVFSVPTGQPASTATTYSYAGPAVPIPDGSTTGASVPIAVTQDGYGSKVTFSIDGTACSTATGATTVGIDHTFVGDLVGTLSNPSGHAVTLFSRSGGGGNNLCQVVFDDAATAPFATVVSGEAPFTGTWKPDEPLAGLLADPVKGTWTFKAVDAAQLDTGSVRAVSLHVTGFATG